MNIKHNKEEVLLKGLNLFCNKGYNNLGIDEICKVTAMTKGAFYNAFKSKEQFLHEAVLLYTKNNVSRIKNQLKAHKQSSACSRLEEFYVGMLQAQPKVNYMGCLINNMMSELGAHHEDVGLMTEKAFNKFIEAILPTVSEAQANNELTSELTAEELTELLHTTFYGLLTRVKSHKNTQQSIKTMQLLFNQLKPKQNE